jgi:hypothetical protein
LQAVLGAEIRLSGDEGHDVVRRRRNSARHSPRPAQEYALIHGARTSKRWKIVQSIGNHHSGNTKIIIYMACLVLLM